MGLFNFGRKKAKEKTSATQTQAQRVPQFQDETEKRWYEARADKQYQKDLQRYYDLCTKVNERYTVINHVGSFMDEAANVLISECVEAFKLQMKVKEKQEYYDQTTIDQAPTMKILAMVYEKRGEYEQAAQVCMMAIDSGFPVDGTTGGMRGRLARMIKKGNLELTDQFKTTLGL